MESGNMKYKKRLQTLFDEVAMDVIYFYFELRILGIQSLFLFLDGNMHVLFHKYISTIPCCQCNTTSLAAPNKPSIIKQEQFNMLFHCKETGRHERTKQGKIEQYCLCKFSPNPSLEINDMDFTLLYILIKSCCKSYPGNPKWLDDIKGIRNYISHLGSTDPPYDEFLDKWNLLETSVLEIAKTVGQTVQNNARRQIENLKAANNSLDDMSTVIKQSTADLKETIVTALSFLNIKIDELSFHVKHSDFRTPRHDRLAPEDEKCRVTWKFDTPGHIKAEEMMEKLNHFRAILNFDVEFIYAGSLVIITSISKNIVYNVELFIEEVKGFIKEIVDKCGIDTTIKAEIGVEIYLLLEHGHGKRKNDLPVLDYTSPESSRDCKVCKEKDDEIKRLKENLDNQLEKEYRRTTMDMRQTSLSLIFGKDSDVDKPLDDFLSAWETEIESNTSFDDFKAERQHSESSNDIEVSPLTSPSIYPEEELATKQGEGKSNKAELEVRVKGGKPEIESSLFSECNSFNINCDTNISVTGIGVTNDNTIIICNVCSEDLLIYSQDGQFLDVCSLIGYPWTISMCVQSKEGIESVHSGVVSIPEQKRYQYITAKGGKVEAARSCCVEFNCYGIKILDDFVLVGGNDNICIFNKRDEVMSSVEIDNVALHIDIYLQIEPFQKVQSDKKYRDDAVKPMIVYLNNQNTIKFVPFPDEDMSFKSDYTGEETELDTIITFSKIGRQDQQTMYGMAVGRHNDIYFTSNSTDDIYKWDTSIQLCRVLGIRNKINKPTTICFNANYDKMFVSTNDGRTITVWNNNEYVNPGFLK